jgi:sterol desaturase/sphingolipid hydroxylase (fatty acid hydroxylase superfamily)
MDLREGNKNYGENLVLWDLMFGTYFDDTRRRPPAKIGIREAMPATLWGQLVAPFVWRRCQAEQGNGRGEETKKADGKSRA